jgi:Tfp pilus assembly PilM family ATPase
MSYGSPKFTRSVFIGYGYIEESLSLSLGLDTETTDYLLAQIDIDPESFEEKTPEIEQAAEIIRPALAELTGEISRTLEFFLSQGISNLDRVIICGAGSTLQGFDRFVGNRLGIETIIGNPLTSIESRVEDLDVNQGSIYVTAIGLALRGLE